MQPAQDAKRGRRGKDGDGMPILVDNKRSDRLKRLSAACEFKDVREKPRFGLVRPEEVCVRMGPRLKHARERDETHS